MSRILLDTSAYSAFMRGHKGIRKRIAQSEEISLNPVVLGELKAGFLGGTRRARNESELGEFLESPRVTVPEIDEGTSDRYATIFDTLKKAGTPIPTNDLWIAASAMQHGLRVVTTDDHFSGVSQILVEYFDPEG